MTLDAQRRMQTGERNEIYVGAGYQQYWDHTQSAMYVGFSPASSVIRTGDVVLRDEWQIVPSRWTASAGIRLDYNSYSHLEYQPSIRLLYTPNVHQSAWIAVLARGAHAGPLRSRHPGRQRVPARRRHSRFTSAWWAPIASARRPNAPPKPDTGSNPGSAGRWIPPSSGAGMDDCVRWLWAPRFRSWTCGGSRSISPSP